MENCRIHFSIWGSAFILTQIMTLFIVVVVLLSSVKVKIVTHTLVPIYQIYLQLPMGLVLEVQLLMNYKFYKV